MHWFDIALLICAVIWIVCGYYAYGFALADLQRRYPRLARTYYRSDQRMAALAALCGPAALVALSTKHMSEGRLYRALTENEVEALLKAQEVAKRKTTATCATGGCSRDC